MRRVEPPEPKKGDIRTRSGFLFLPRKIGREWRWLERATWKEEVRWECEGKKIVWEPFRWINVGDASDKDSLLRPHGNAPEPTPDSGSDMKDRANQDYGEGYLLLMKMRPQDWPTLLPPPAPNPADQFAYPNGVRPPPPPPSSLMPNPGQYYPCADWALLGKALFDIFIIVIFIVTIYHLFQ